MKNWSLGIKKTIEVKLEGVKDRDLRFFRIDEFIRNIERTEEFAPNCHECNRHKDDITITIENIDEAINVPGKTRREFDRVIGKLSSHMMKAHQFYNPYYFTYLISFFGMVAGLLLGYLGTKLFPTDDWIALTIGFSIGLITGHIIGSKKDKVIRKNKKLM